ncbi:MAG TPA: MarR family winged helix-turn-helix transcriptional regulator [Candidatus Aminicenantes bacterium]|nr:MarR family winged helix-turn-helix transcriptional regulator [Candidatus Aminicenantes bacterium]
MSRAKQLAISRIGVIHLTWTRRLARQLLPFGLTLKQLHVLQELARRPVLYPAQIAGMLYCDRPTATVILRNLENQGWIEREPDLENRRRTRVVITPRGRAKVAEVAAAGFAGNRGLDLNRLFSAEEEEQLNALLRRLQDHLEGPG